MKRAICQRTAALYGGCGRGSGILIETQVIACIAFLDTSHHCASSEGCLHMLELWVQLTV